MFLSLHFLFCPNNILNRYFIKTKRNIYITETHSIYVHIFDFTIEYLVLFSKQNISLELCLWCKKEHCLHLVIVVTYQLGLGLYNEQKRLMCKTLQKYLSIFFKAKLLKFISFFHSQNGKEKVTPFNYLTLDWKNKKCSN